MKITLSETMEEALRRKVHCPADTINDRTGRALQRRGFVGWNGESWEPTLQAYTYIEFGKIHFSVKEAEEFLGIN